MKITIDTKEDSHEEIKKVIRMLQNLVGEEKVYSNQGNIFDDSKETPTENVFGNLFGNDNKESKESPLKEEKPSEEEKKDVPEIMAYDL